MYSDAFPAVSPYAAGKLKFLFFEGKDKQTKAIPKKTAGKASKKTEARQSTVSREGCSAWKYNIMEIFYFVNFFVNLCQKATSDAVNFY